VSTFLVSLLFSSIFYRLFLFFSPLYYPATILLLLSLLFSFFPAMFSYSLVAPIVERVFSSHPDFFAALLALAYHRHPHSHNNRIATFFYYPRCCYILPAPLFPSCHPLCFSYYPSLLFLLYAVIMLGHYASIWFGDYILIPIRYDMLLYAFGSGWNTMLL